VSEEGARPNLDRVIPRTLPLGPPPPRPLDPGRLAIRPAVRRWARSLVRTLAPMVRRAPPRVRRRLLLVFIDGVGGRAMRRAEKAGWLRFLPTLRDGPTHVESRAFSGMPSTTTAFQAGLFFGAEHPDVPSFSWFDRRLGRKLQMNRPSDALLVEERLRDALGPGLLAGGTSYVSILAGGSGNALTTAGLGQAFRARRIRRDRGRGGEGPDPAHEARVEEAIAAAAGTTVPIGRGEPEEPAAAGWRADAVIQGQILGSLLFRLATESADFLGTMARFRGWFGSGRHELRFLLNHLAVGTLATEFGKGGAILDLMRGVPRTFVCLHEYDEFSHRRGTRDALRVLAQIDRAVEALVAIAAEVPDPPDVWILTDHGQIPAVPFERIFGRTIASWLTEGPAPALPPAVERLVGASGARRPHEPPVVVDCGNYAHVYLGGDRAWDAAEISRMRSDVLSRALDCPGVGLVAMRSLRHGPIAFAGGRQVDPSRPDTIPKGASREGVAALLAELGRSPSAGDLLLCGSWFDDACVAYSWELSSHGGPSQEETETFVLHPAGVDPGRVAHGADLHAILTALYGAEEPTPFA